MNYAVIMAGGTGKRLWPLSRQKRPKQVLRSWTADVLDAVSSGSGRFSIRATSSF